MSFRIVAPLVVHWLADRLNSWGAVDGILPWDPAQIAPRVLRLILIINVLTQRDPLHAVETWAAELPLSLWWGDAIEAGQFNDDALAWLLEQVVAHGPSPIATLGMRMQTVH